MTPATPAHCCLSADAAPVNVAAGGTALLAAEELAGAALVAVVETMVVAAALVADAVAAGAVAGALGTLIVMPAEAQNDWANAMVSIRDASVQASRTESVGMQGPILAWSVALQAVLMHVWTELRKLVAEQMQAASVVAQPVAPIALRAQVTWFYVS